MTDFKSKALKYKIKYFNLKGGGNKIPVMIFPESHTITEISTNIIELFVENTIFPKYNPKNILFVNEGEIRDELFEKISKLPHNFSNSIFINEGVLIENIIAILCSLFKEFDYLFLEVIPSIIEGLKELKLGPENFDTIFKEPQYQRILGSFLEYLNKIMKFIENEDIYRNVLDLFNKQSLLYLTNAITLREYKLKINQVTKLIIVSFIKKINKNSKYDYIISELNKYYLVDNIKDKSIINNLIRKLCRNIRDPLLINKIENFICENSNIQVVIILCGCNHYIDLYNLISRCSLITNLVVNVKVIEYLNSKRILDFDSFSSSESNQELTNIYKIIKEKMKLDQSKENTKFINHCSVCYKNKYDNEIITPCICGKKAYCCIEHLTKECNEHQSK